MTESEIFKAAVHIPPDRRAVYLDQACGPDPGLRRDVESLLRAHDAPGSFLHPPRPEATADACPVAERPGTVIGPYRLMEQIGEGGFGLVFVAEQTEPVRRKVALKVIKPGMDTRQVVARFEAERQAIALMDHPHIAKVFDAGTTATGRPYFVMELVKGLPITDYCDRHQLPARDRLNLFVAVCQAVQHAHGKGVIHRDLKPSNVLVAPHDGIPVVKVIDFGVAKAVGQRLTDKTIYTRFAQMIGTPLYMSPEQAEINALDVDTRSDVYSLGVLLYELLTGTTPFERTRFAAAAYDEIRRIIREEEPPRPSTRLSTLGDTVYAAETARKTESKKLSALVKGDLDWVVMKALEKDRGRRYETASALAADVRRFLAEEPVEARPPSAWYRFGKLARRNRAALTTAGVVAAALVLGTGVSLWQAVRATGAESAAVAAADEKQLALARAEQQRDEKDRALLAEAEQQLRTLDERDKARAAEADATQRRDEAVAQRKRADAAAAAVKSLNDFLLYDLLVQAGNRDVLDHAAKRIEGKFADQPLVAAPILYTIGDVYTRFGAWRETVEQVSRALDLLERSRPLSERDEGLAAECQYTLGEAYVWLKDYGRATDVLLACEKHPYYKSHPLVLTRLGICRLHDRQFEEAETRLRAAIATKSGGWEAFHARSLLGEVLIRRQKYADAEQFVLAGYQGLRDAEPKMRPHERVLAAEAIERAVLLYTDWGKPDEAAKWRKELEARRAAETKPKQ